MKKTTYKEKRFSDFREIVNFSASAFRHRTAFLIRKTEGGYHHISYQELKNRFYAMCKAFLDAGLGGKRIAVIGSNCFEWVLSYLCAATVGVAVPIDKELSCEDMQSFFASASCAAVCTEAKLIAELRKNTENDQRTFISFDSVMKMSEAASAVACEEVDRIAIPENQMQILIFTSGTTGNSKGVCLSQYNICSNIYSTVSVVKIRPEDRTLSILPIHHTYECTLDCLLLLSRGACITYCDGLTHIKKNIMEYRPTVLVVVPLLLKNLDKQISAGIVKSCPAKYRELFQTKPLSEALAETPFPIRKIICHRVRKTLGGKLRLFIVGAADLDVSLVTDFTALGIRTLQGYGLTECAPLLAGNSDFFMNPASTGRAIPGVTLKIDRPNEDGIGEILAKGDNIMLGYYNDEEATAAVFRDGWFCTGDLGYMDKDGALFIMGRRKNVIVTQNGKNIYPEELESRLSGYPEIKEALVIAESIGGDIGVKAKVFPNADYLKEALGHMPSVEEKQKAIQNAVCDVNAKIPGYKRIKALEVLDKALEKTTTQKIKRFGANAL